MSRRSATTRNRTLAAETFDAARVVHLVGAASADEYAEGVAWYHVAHDHAARYGAAYGVSTDAAAGIIAALSPQLNWDLNLRYAETFLRTGGDPSGHFAHCDRKATAILHGADPLSTLGGPKVRSFYRNIANPDASGAVTVDRHACAVLYGTDTPTYLRTLPKFLDRRHVYQLAAARYRGAARTLGLAPHVCQAVAWVAHRNAQGARIPAATDTYAGF
jgi:hypothetical protein